MFLGAMTPGREAGGPILAGGPQEVVRTRCIKHDCNNVPAAKLSGRHQFH